MPFVSGHKHDLFVSYAHAEAAWVEGFTKALCAEFHDRAGEPVTLWQDTQNLRLGQKWASEIEEGIRHAAAFLAIVSPTYLKSSWCAQERAIALENDLEALKVESFYRFLKIVKRPGPGNAHKEMLEDLQYLGFFNETDTYELAAGSPEFTAVIRACVRQIRELLSFMSNKGHEVYLAPGDIDSDEPLFVTGLGLDSIDGLELGVAIRKKYGLKVQGTKEQIRAIFQTVRTIAQYLAEQESH